MPIYEYLCSKCHELSDALQKVNDPAPEVCPNCGAKQTLARQVSRTSFVLKGGGWYADLYSSSKAKSEGGESKPAASTPGASSSGGSSTADTGSGSTGGGTSSASGSSGSSGSGPVNSAPKVAAAKA